MNLKKLRPVLLLTLVLVLLISATGAAFAKSERVRFTINNKSDKIFSLQMAGPETLYLVVQPNSVGVFTPLRGAYSYTMFSCGAYANNNIDLSTMKTMVVPECGSGGPSSKSENKVDASDTIKLVKVTVENKATNSVMVVIFTGPGTYVFSLKAGQKANYTVPRGVYNVTYYACSASATRTFEAKANKTLSLSCPK